MSENTYIRFPTTIITALLMAGFLSFGSSGAVYADSTRTVNTGWLLESAKNLILTSDPWQDLGCTVSIDSTPSDINIYRSGEIEVTAVLDRSPNSFRDIGAVSVEVYVDGEIYIRFDPSPYLSVSAPVFKTTRSLDRGEVLSESDFEAVSVDVREIPSGEIFTSADDIIGLSARMNITSGKILTDSLLELPTLVFRGDVVYVVVPFGNISVTLKGTALDSGAMGDEIRVRNPDSNVIIDAVVTGPSTAEVII